MFTFIETKLFTRLVEAYLPDDEYANLQRTIAEDPNAGDVIRGRVAFGNFDGDYLVAASVAAFASSTTCGYSKARSGC